jgi:hypothetical protein
MTNIEVTCQKCNHAWHRIGTWTVYEREATETLPCPACGAYTLSCPEPTAASTRLRPVWNRRAKVEPVNRAA